MTSPPLSSSSFSSSSSSFLSFATYSSCINGFLAVVFGVFIGITIGIAVFAKFLESLIVQSEAAANTAFTVNSGITTMAFPSIATKLLSAFLSLLADYWHYPVYGILIVAGVYVYYKLIIEKVSGYYPLSVEEKMKLMSRPYGKEMPPPFPTCWYKLMLSEELRVGESKALHFFERELVIFRAAGDSNGKGRGMVHVLDGYCPHLGAHLGVGGKVVGNCIECPFHGWCFDGSSGQCASIPYSDKAPPETARVSTWHVREVNRQIYIWYDSAGRAPTWEIPIISADIAHWRFHGEVVNEVSCHAQEIPENGADIEHLNFLHGPFVIPFIKCLKHLWDATYTPLPEPNAHMALITVDTAFGLYGKPIEFTRYKTNVYQIGHGLVHMHFNTMFGRVVTMESVTPVGRYYQRVTNLAFAEPWVPRILVKFFLVGIKTQFQRDIPIWNNKRFLRTPMQVKGDGPLLQYRRWSKQFYNEEENENGKERNNGKNTNGSVQVNEESVGKCETPAKSLEW